MAKTQWEGQFNPGDSRRPRCPIGHVILWQIATWMGWLVAIAGNLILLPLALVAAAGVIILLRIILGK